MSSIAIVDDQEAFQNKISYVVQQYYCEQGNKCDIKIFNSAKMLLFQMGEIYFDIYILDIEMPGMDGMKLAEEIKKKYPKTYIIFVTSHVEYAISAFDVHAYKYILKSQIENKLAPALNEIEKSIEIEDTDYYVVNTKSRYEKIYYKKILYIYKESKNSVIVKCDDPTFTRCSIQNIYKELDQKQFVFIDRGYIVNIIHVMKINCNELFLRNGKTLIICRSRVNEVKEKVHNYWKDKAI